MQLMNCTKKIEVAHLDIRLENICFKESDGEFSAVLIDLNRCAPVSKLSDFIMYSKSCMYQKPAGEWFTNKKFDWMQLGWLAVWVTCKHLVNYHQMDYDSLPSDHQEDEFKDLPTKGLSFYNLYSKSLTFCCVLLNVIGTCSRDALPGSVVYHTTSTLSQVLWERT